MAKIDIDIADLESILTNCRDDHTAQELQDFEEDLANLQHAKHVWDSIKSPAICEDALGKCRLTYAISIEGPLPGKIINNFPENTLLSDVYTWFEKTFYISTDDLTDDPPTWKELMADYENVERMPLLPAGLAKFGLNHVFDENKSVKWNREKVAAENARYQEEANRLTALRNKRRTEVLENIYTFIQNTVGHNLSRNKAIAIWNYAYDKGHATGISEITAHLDEIIRLADTLLADMD